MVVWLGTGRVLGFVASGRESRATDVHKTYVHDQYLARKAVRLMAWPVVMRLVSRFRRQTAGLDARVSKSAPCSEDTPQKRNNGS